MLYLIRLTYFKKYLNLIFEVSNLSYYFIWLRCNEMFAFKARLTAARVLIKGLHYSEADVFYSFKFKLIYINDKKSNVIDLFFIVLCN